MAGALTLECRHPDCAERGTREEFPTDRYCSEACKTRHAGRQILSTLVYDHKYCSVCFTKLKEVEYADAILSNNPNKYSRLTPRNFIGYQYRTPAADTGEKERHEGPPPLIGTGTVCGTCGTTATNAWPTAEELVDPEDAAQRFVTAYRYEHPGEEIDAETVVRVAAETGDLQLAVGRGVEQA